MRPETASSWSLCENAPKWHCIMQMRVLAGVQTWGCLESSILRNLPMKCSLFVYLFVFLCWHCSQPGYSGESFWISYQDFKEAHNFQVSYSIHLLCHKDDVPFGLHAYWKPPSGGAGPSTLPIHTHTQRRMSWKGESRRSTQKPGVGSLGGESLESLWESQLCKHLDFI